MNKLFLSIFALLVLTVSAPAANIIWGSGIPVRGTTNSVVMDTNTVAPIVQKITVSYTATNPATIFTGNVIATLDKTNFINVGTFTYTGTNFSTNVQSYFATVPVYFFLQSVTDPTNTIVINAQYGN
jgi:hypothetical protein